MIAPMNFAALNLTRTSTTTASGGSWGGWPR